MIFTLNRNKRKSSIANSNAMNSENESDESDINTLKKKEKEQSDMQYEKAQMLGKDKYIAQLKHELELIKLLRWKETQGNASSVGEVTGESNIEDTDIAEIERKIEYVTKRYADFSDVNGKFEMLNINNVLYDITKAENFKVTADISVDKMILSGNGNTVLDGSLCVKVTDSNGNETAVGYMCADGFNETDLEKVGFVGKTDNNRSRKLTALCITNNDIRPGKDEKYSVTITPYRLWTVEK